MSRHHLLNAARDRIRSALGYSPVECEVMDPPGKPPARSGKRFWSVWGNDVTDQGNGIAEDEMYAITCTLSMRINEPKDRIGTDLLQKVKSGAEDLAAAVRTLLNMDYTTMNAANAALWAAATIPVGGFIEPLRHLGTSTPRTVAGDWFVGKGGEVGVAIDVRFGKCRRVQTVGSAT